MCLLQIRIFPTFGIRTFSSLNPWLRGQILTPVYRCLQMGGLESRPPFHHWLPRHRIGVACRLFVAPLHDTTCSEYTRLYLRAVTPIHLVAHPTRRVWHQFWECQLRSIVMDYTKIPHFAKCRQVGTVIIRVKMEIPESTCSSEACCRTEYPRSMHRPLRCKQCSRTRSNSDCGSGIARRYRSYRSSSARSSKHF